MYKFFEIPWLYINKVFKFLKDFPELFKMYSRQLKTIYYAFSNEVNVDSVKKEQSEQHVPWNQESYPKHLQFTPSLEQNRKLASIQNKSILWL